MSASFDMVPIGHVRGGRSEPIDDDWDSVEATIALDPQRFDPSALAQLDAFSHVEVVYVFDRVGDEEIQTGARRPRDNPDWPAVGIFAQRGKGRPNRIGVTRCALLAVDGLELRVRGLDAVDGTPVLDVKPHMRQFDARGEVRQPAWSDELMRGYWDVR
jgi:tRNA (adenine37-N6)-methyltransferase